MHNWKQEAETFIEKSWAAHQIIFAPKLCPVNKKNNDECFKLNNYYATIKINTEMRHKGIFDIPVYTADVDLKGDFIIDKKTAVKKSADKKLILSYDIKDPKGLIEAPLILFDNNKIHSDSFENILTNNFKTGNVPFEFKYKIRGTSEISVIFSGLKNNVNISGNWGNPSFSGDTLPVTSTIERDKFSAKWYQPINSENHNRFYDYKAVVSLNVPVDNYRMSERALKYASLFIGLTFLIYFIFELVSKESEKIHPLQYCIIATAILLFYLLLVAFSEFIPFYIAYFTSAFMVISMISCYTYFVLTHKNKYFSVFIFSSFILLYIFLYILLFLQEFSFIIGSIGLFIILCIVMYVTRKVNWYNDN